MDMIFYIILGLGLGFIAGYFFAKKNTASSDIDLDIEKIKKEMENSFKALASDVAKDNTKQFFELANDKFQNLSKESDANLEEKKKGLAAKARTKELLEKVSTKPGYFRLKSYGLGKYGRVLGEIFILDENGNTICVNNQLISEGHAYIYDGGKKKVFTS